MKKGVFITFEGPEGSGKSTHSCRLAEELVSDGYDVVHTAEPGSTGLGGKIREILLMKDEVALSPESELFLFEADRAQHVIEVIGPAIKAGRIVLCDRFNTATMAYQGYGLGMSRDLISTIDLAATGGMIPDLTVILDIEVATGLRRASNTRSADRVEKRSLEFHEKVRTGYLEIASRNRERIKVVDASGDIEDIYRKVREEVYAVIRGYKGTD
ncbi:MAG: dTMP kinase [Candidatus Omnitrophica bacterium]|nr:dTMP kinase [Candidatus Omnitrophota bacterium]MDD5487645.1 dTMP kinase [Candidatus Omnitrophota bacterium]